MAMSRGELKIKDILEENNICFEQEYIFPDLITTSGKPLRFDFAVFDDDGNLDYLVEFQGEQHYTSVAHFGGQKHLQTQKFNDLTKRKYCYQKNYKLVAIPYWDYDKLDFSYLIEKSEEFR
jgi:hypothetical protein